MTEQPGTGPAAPKASFRDRVEGHPIGLLMAVAVAAVTATLAVVVPMVQLTQDNRVSAVEVQMEQTKVQHAAEIAALQSQLDDLGRRSEQELADERVRTQARINELDRSLSSIHRTLGANTQDYDVSTLVVDPADVSSLPSTSTFFPDDRFYALDVAQSTNWAYEVSSELRLTAELVGLTEDALRAQATAEQAQALTQFPVHVWRYGADQPISYVDPESGSTFELRPRTQAWVQRVNKAEYLSFILDSVPSPQPSGSTIAETIRDGFESDPAGWVLQDQLVSEITGVGSLRPRIDSLQKRDDLAYARVETVLPNVTIGDRTLAEYYWDREWFIVRTDRDMYLVKLYVADDDHRSPDYGALSAWLDQLRILRS